MAGSIAVIPSDGATPQPPTHNYNERKLKDVAAQFEALLIGQLLKSGRESSGAGWMGTSLEEAGSSVLDMAEQQLVQVLASQGGLGIARLVISGLKQER